LILGRDTERHLQSCFETSRLEGREIRNLRYVVVIEKGEANYGAYVPDLPGCAAGGNTMQEVEERIRGAIDFHIRGLREDGMEGPPPTSIATEVEVNT
jgi:predicted RNase H-like HicB family nuclease